MVNTIIMFSMLIASTAMIGYLALVGRLTSRAVFILTPAATLAISVLTLLADAQNPLLPYAAMTMMAVALTLMVTAGVLLVMSSGRTGSAEKASETKDPPPGGV